MCIGLKCREDERFLGDMMREPYASMKLKKKVFPTQKHLVEEIKRRSKCNKVESPSCTYWKRDKLALWLTANPVHEVEDVVYLRREESQLYKTLVNNAVGEVSSDKGGVWNTNDPYLRLYHCLFSEDARDALMNMNNVMTRPELDARNSAERPETLYEVVANLFNDPSNVYITEQVPDLHHVFAYPITLSFDDMPGEVTPEEVKKRFANARAQMIKIIANWEISGNGFGQREPEDADYGHMDEERLSAGDNRSHFLWDKAKEHILYFWHMADRSELLKNVLNVICHSSVANSDTYHSTSELSSAAAQATNKRKANDARSADAFRDRMGQAMSVMSQAAILQELRESEAQSMRYEEQAIMTENASLKALYLKHVARQEDRIAQLQNAMDKAKRRRLIVGNGIDSSDEE